MVECDAAPEEARKKLETVLGPATVAVASGGLWTDPDTGEISPKLHLYWRLRQPTRQFSDHVALKEIRRLAKIFAGSDGSAVPMCHPLRWPGSWHRKNEPRLAQIVAYNPDAEIELRDALDRLREVVEVTGRPRQSGESRASYSPQADPQDIAAALASIPNNDLPWDEWDSDRAGNMARFRRVGGSDLPPLQLGRPNQPRTFGAKRARAGIISRDHPRPRSALGALSHLAL